VDGESLMERLELSLVAVLACSMVGICGQKIIINKKNRVYSAWKNVYANGGATLTSWKQIYKGVCLGHMTMKGSQVHLHYGM
jgi:hypothetical protein